MGPIQRTPKANKFLQEYDIISSMPENVITHILDCLPMQDAARTGILSRDWRFKWTTLSQLVFDDKFYTYLNHKHLVYQGSIISRLLFLHRGVITKFVLYVYNIIHINIMDINSWVLFLSTSRIKDFTLINYFEIPIRMPTYLFSCLELKHLKLDKCFVCPIPNSHRFPNMLSLELSSVVFSSCTLSEFLGRCPLLEILSLSSNYSTGNIELDEIAKLENLKELRFPLFELDKRVTITSSYVLQHISLFSKLKELCLDFSYFKISGSTKERFWTPLPCLRALELNKIDFSGAKMVSFAYALICCSPNVETLRIKAKYKDLVPPPVICSSEVHCSRMGQLQLRDVAVLCIRGLEDEVRLMKSLLISSPLLGRLIVTADSSKVCGGYRGHIMFAAKLLTLPRVSPIARIKLSWF